MITNPDKISYASNKFCKYRPCYNLTLGSEEKDDLRKKIAKMIEEAVV